jgi:hypothetical protein
MTPNTKWLLVALAPLALSASFLIGFAWVLDTNDSPVQIGQTWDSVIAIPEFQGLIYQATKPDDDTWIMDISRYRVTLKRPHLPELGPYRVTQIELTKKANNQ